MTRSKHELDLGWCRVVFEVTDMITDEVFVWAEGVRFPTKDELREARDWARSLSPSFFLYANVDTTNAQHLQFAKFFGFREVRRVNSIAVMVWEREKCKLFLSD